MVIYSQQITKLSQRSLTAAGVFLCESHQQQLTELKLNGVGFRGYTYHDRSILNVGYSHYICLWSAEFHRCRRQRLICHSSLTEKFQQLKFPDPYRQRGIQNLRYKLKLKEGKKR